MTRQITTQSHDSVELAQLSLTPSQEALARELELTAANSNRELSQAITDELFRLYSKRSPEAIEFVFRAHRERSPFWPAIAELAALFGEFYRGQQEQADHAYLESLRETRKRLDAAGLPSGEAQVIAIRKQLLAMVKSMDEATPERKQELRTSLEQHLAERKQKKSSGEK